MPSNANSLLPGSLVDHDHILVDLILGLVAVAVIGRAALWLARSRRRRPVSPRRLNDDVGRRDPGVIAVTWPVDQGACASCRGGRRRYRLSDGTVRHYFCDTCQGTGRAILAEMRSATVIDLCDRVRRRASQRSS